ncbi:uncharacterized protein LOC131848252 [Achroia grisella]|uniref:uncharacterized protein LOC131848252 n=1 Tax=Achroia grisella TaxID=688607 RepID=UPI0027D1F615|nr:uncharacterized protein LOC131848252 [Achroia grisella]
MRKKSYICVLLLILVFEAFCEENNDDPAEEDLYAVPEGYSQIFRDLPTVYEYIIATLQDKPEVLENNNSPAFDDLNRKENHVNKRSANYFSVNAYEVNDGNVKVDNYLSNIDYGVVLIGSDGAYKSLDPEEVAAKAIWVEQELEDYNNEK